MSLVALIIIGIAAGYLATQIMDVKANVVVTIAIGILGALVGSIALRALVALLGLMAGFVGAVLGAMLLIWLWENYGPES